MSPRQSRKSFHSATDDDERPGENDDYADVDPQSLHDQTTTDVLKTAQDLVALSKQRRGARRKEIEAEYEKKTKDIAARINALFESRKNRVTKSQKAQWDRLDTLNKKRSSLEALILASMRSIEQHSANISNEMAAMFGGRIEDIQETALQHGKEM